MSIRFEKIPGAPRIAIDCAGTGPAVILLHGVGGNRGNWADQLAALSRDFRSIAWDARGYGDSDDYAGPWRFADVAADLVRVLDHFDIGAAHVIGLSMGGMIAQEFWKAFPDRVRSLVLCDTVSGPDEGLSPMERVQFLAARKAPLLAGQTPKDIAPKIAATLAAPNAAPATLQRLVDSMAQLRSGNYIKALDAVAAWDGIGDLSQIRVPTGVIVGAEDRLTTPSVARKLAAGIPGASLVVVPGAGHLCNIENPEFFNRAVLEFLRSAETGRRSHVDRPQ